MSRSQTFLRHAPRFTPVFRASDLGTFCNSPKEKTELKFVLKYFPFYIYKPKKFTSGLNEYEHETFTDILKPEHKDLIKKEWETHFSSKTLSFDDNQIAEKVNTNIQSSFGVKDEASANILDLNEDSESNMTDDGLFKLEKYKSVAKSFISMERGNQLEKNIIDTINVNENMNFVQDKELKFFDFGFFKICGIIDGIDVEKQTLIEVKTRNIISTNNTISLKERIQCLCYMKLTNCHKCLLVESGPDGSQNIIKIAYDDIEFEDRVLNKLRDFVIKYREMDANEFKKSVDKYKFVN